MTGEQHKDGHARLVAQMDATERWVSADALERMARAKSQAWFTRHLNDFGDWYRQRRGLPPRDKVRRNA